MKFIKDVFLTFILTVTVVWAQTTVVLQNGSNGYSGCRDVYIGNDKLSEVYPDVNDHTSWMLVVGKYVR